MIAGKSFKFDYIWLIVVNDLRSPVEGHEAKDEDEGAEADEGNGVAHHHNLRLK